MDLGRGRRRGAERNGSFTGSANGLMKPDLEGSEHSNAPNPRLYIDF